MSESLLIVVFLSFIYPQCFKIDIEQDEISKALLIKQETEWIEWFGTFLLTSSILD